MAVKKVRLCACAGQGFALDGIEGNSPGKGPKILAYASPMLKEGDIKDYLSAISSCRWLKLAGSLKKEKIWAELVSVRKFEGKQRDR
jgi:hypothetical protein